MKQLERVFTIPQVAKMAGWSRTRMWRHLKRLNDAQGGTLLHKVGDGTKRSHWTITLASLRSIAPQWFNDPEATQRQIDWLSSELEATRASIAALSRRVTMQHEKLVALAKLASTRQDSGSGSREPPRSSA